MTARPEARIRDERAVRVYSTRVKKDNSFNPYMAMLALFFSMRQTFVNCRILHLAVDASTVGNKNWLLGFITVPGGGAAWLPPPPPQDRLLCVYIT